MLVAASDAAAVVQRINEGGDISRGSGVDAASSQAATNLLLVHSVSQRHPGESA